LLCFVLVFFVFHLALPYLFSFGFMRNFFFLSPYIFLYLFIRIDLLYGGIHYDNPGYLGTIVSVWGHISSCPSTRTMYHNKLNADVHLKTQLSFIKPDIKEICKKGRTVLLFSQNYILFQKIVIFHERCYVYLYEMSILLVLNELINILSFNCYCGKQWYNLHKMSLLILFSFGTRSCSVVQAGIELLGSGNPASACWGAGITSMYHQTQLVLTNFFFLAEFGLELMTSHLLGRCSITWAMPSAIFALVIFQIESQTFAQAALRLQSYNLHLPSSWWQEPPCPVSSVILRYKRILRSKGFTMATFWIA
jgi:hypothetical protein